MSRKINQEQLKIDRKLAWERVNELLGGSDDDDDDESKVKDKEKPGKKTQRCIFFLSWRIITTLENALISPIY